MIIFKKAAEIAGFIENQRKNGKKTGFVPTMGALHEGHISLIRKCKNEQDLTVCSIFVNPTQFNNTADFEKYPITIEKDIDMLEAAGCNLLFLPSVDEIYPPGHLKEHYELGYLETILEGKYRPGHFQGVCMVVDQLLSIIHCDALYLGQKDYQQCMVISQMAKLKQYHTDIRISETVRENDGLAMSSRNARLNEGERTQAVAIFETLQYIKNNLRPGKLAQLKKEAVAFLTVRGFTVDYVELASRQLQFPEKWDGHEPLVALIAAYLNEVRLIDNMTVS